MCDNSKFDDTCRFIYLSDSFNYLCFACVSFVKHFTVLLTSDGHIKICDMGLAKGSKNSTTTGAVGTVVYMAPEVFGGEADVDVEEGEDNDEWVPLPAQEDDPNADGANDLESKGAKMAEGNNKRNDPRASDVYALGIMLWQLWHREVPFYGLTHLKVLLISQA